MVPQTAVVLDDALVVEVLQQLDLALQSAHLLLDHSNHNNNHMTAVQEVSPLTNRVPELGAGTQTERRHSEPRNRLERALSEPRAEFLKNSSCVYL